jgi:hypothetical protein
MNVSRCVLSLFGWPLAALALVGCADDGCEAGSTTLSYDKQSSLGFSLKQALSTRLSQSGKLEWHAPPEWFAYSGSGETTIVTIATYDKAKVEEQSGYGTECATLLTSKVTVELATTDGQLRGAVTADVTANAKNAYTLTAVFAKADLEGILRIGSNGALVVSYDVDGNDVVGQVRGQVEEQTDVTSHLRQATFATWKGSVDADAELPAQGIAPMPSSEPTLIDDPEPPPSSADAGTSEDAATP